jgi:hypothetical protein
MTSGRERSPLRSHDWLLDTNERLFSIVIQRFIQNKKVAVHFVLFCLQLQPIIPGLERQVRNEHPIAALEGIDYHAPDGVTSQSHYAWQSHDNGKRKHIRCARSAGRIISSDKCRMNGKFWTIFFYAQCEGGV